MPLRDKDDSSINESNSKTVSVLQGAGHASRMRSVVDDGGLQTLSKSEMATSTPDKKIAHNPDETNSIS